MGFILVLCLVFYLYMRRRKHKRNTARQVTEKHPELIEATERPSELSSVKRPSELHNKLDMYTELDASHKPRNP